MNLKEKNINFFKTMLDDVNVGGLFIDTTRTVRYCNGNIEKIFGYSLSDVIGKQTEFLYGDRRNNLADKNKIYKVLEKKGFHVGYAKGLTNEGREIKIQLTTFVIKPNSGAIIFVKRIEKYVEASINKECLVQDLLDNIPDMVYFKDLNNRFILVNKAHADALNLTPKEIIGKTDLDFFPGEIAKKYYADDSHVIKTGKAIIGKIEKAKRPDGGNTYVSTTKVPHHDEEGRIIGTIGITRNITDKMIAVEELRVYKDNLEDLVEDRTKELKGSNERLLHMYNVKSELTSMVSHELKTPITAIKILIETLKKNKIKQDKEQYYNMVIEEFDRLTRLINDMLDFSKLENKKMKFKTLKGNLNEVINQVLKSYETSINEQGLKLNVSLDPSLPLVSFDPDRITQVFYNLINNALKFTDTGSISVESKADKKEVKVIIKDTGYGIKTEDLARIFEKFEQVSSDNRPVKGGTGLGLAICKQIIEQLGGKILVESKFGKGSKFSISLPIKP